MPKGRTAGTETYTDDRFFSLMMAFLVPNRTVVHPIAIRWTDNDGTEFVTDYWAPLRPNGRIVEALSVLEVDFRPYINYETIDEQLDCQEESVGSVNQVVEIADVDPTRKRKGTDNDFDAEPVAKEMRRGRSSADDEYLKQRLRYPYEGPLRWGNCNENLQEEVIDLSTSDPETDEDDDYNNEDGNDDFIGVEDDEDDDDSDDLDDSPEIMTFTWK